MTRICVDLQNVRIVLNRPCFHGKDGKPMFNLINVNHSYV